jgi:hypothetical protein
MRLLAALLIVALLVPLVRAQDREVRPADDPRLQSKFTKNFEATSLADLLKTFADDTGVAIKAGRDTASDMIVLAVKDQTYGEVMERIAEHFDFTWETSGEAPNVSYALTQSTDQAKREAKLRAEQEMARLAAARQEISEDAALTQAEIDEMMQKCTKWAQEEPEVDWKAVAARRELGNHEESQPETAHRAWQVREEARMARRMMPDRLALVRFLNKLSERDWQRIASGDPVTYATPSRSYQKRLPASWLKDVRSWVSQSPYAGGPPRGEEPEDPVARMRLPAFEPTDLFYDLPKDAPLPTIAAASLILRSEPGFEWYGISATLVAMDALRQPIFIDEFEFGGWPWPPGLQMVEGEGTRPDYSKDPILGKVVKYPERMEGLFSRDEGAQVSAMLTILKRVGEIDPLNIADAPSRLAIADSAGVSMVSDIYDRQGGSFAALFGLDALMGRAGGRAGDELDSLKRSAGVTWKLEDGWISLRTDQWAYLRPRQLPRDLAKTLLKLSLKGTEVTLDEVASLVASATELQFEIESLQASGPMTEMLGPASLLAQPLSRGVLRFWHGLPKQSRNQLLAGQPLLLNRLAPTVRDPLIGLLQEATLSDTQPSMVGLSHYSELSIGRPEETPRWLDPPSPFDWTEYVPQKSPAPLAITLQVEHGDGFYMAMDLEGTGSLMDLRIPTSAIGPMLEGFADDQAEMAAYGVKPSFGREKVERYTFRIHLTDRYAISVPIVLGFHVPDSEFDPKHPPDDVLRLIDESKRQMEEELAPPPEDEGF